MAKKSAVERNKKRILLAKRYAAKRNMLKQISCNSQASPEERFAANLKLAKLPRNSAKVRQRLRCELTGRSRGNYRKFGVCRIILRDLAATGQVPGLVKSSW